MQKYCQPCGSSLTAVGDHGKYWITFYRCARRCDAAATYLDVADARWIYPLQFLERDTLARAASLPDEVIALAASRIKRIDYKTISVVYFERTIAATYRDGEEYAVVHPER